LFFVLIVGLPMVVIALLATRTADEASEGKADARLFAGMETATVLYEDRVAEARAAAKSIGADPALAAAVRAGDPGQARSIASALARENGVEALRLRTPAGEELAAVGPEPFAPAELALEDGGAEAATLTVAVGPREEYLDEVERLSGREAALAVDGEPAVTLAGGERVEVPAQGAATVTISGAEQRVLMESLPGSEGPRLALFGPPPESALLSSSPLVVTVVLAALGVALLLALYLRRNISRQIAAMLDAAKRIGSGDFSRRVPVIGRGRDEMSGLATEFNKMSDRLATQMDQLRRQQSEIDRSVRRIGEAFTAGLDRESLLRIVAETAVSACAGQYGLIALSGREGAEVSAGTAADAVEDAVLAAEAKATRSDVPIEHGARGAHALSAPLRRIGDPGHNLGVMTVARTGEPFTAAERDVFLYLIGQASASIENVALHELVSEQAVTDDLTGLANNRAFHEFAEKEAARADRFGHSLSLLMLDIDDFKRVNDTHGHLQGDEVLRRIGRILQAESREIDEPARYGGEEFVVALPETDSEGAFDFAERVRERVEAERVPFPERDGNLRITASLGVASIPESAGDVQGLLAAADAALYAAKRAGKNRVVLAPSLSDREARRGAPAASDG
jgi:diguanylate cyclase (GGDEF)-like protein